ncbi:MAG: acyl-CoA dehydrogenase C-terminal domain-containing protein [Candidatus Thiodiazotropha sp.]
MLSYKAPLRDMRFIFDEVLDGSRLQALSGFEEVDPDTVEAILEEAGKFCENELLPLNRDGDEEGCRWEGGRVTTPKGFKEAYRSLCESGWNSIAMDADYGGQGLPKTLHLMIDEMICSSNLSFSLYPGLTNGAYAALAAYASDEIKETYFPRMADGTWSASMCLTEPHCGTDLGLLRTRAVPQDDGSYRISGTKIFITAGEHDLTDNILHLVLARTPDAPKGIKGISLFLVPKILVGDDGSLGEANGVTCGSIEHKMGIKASATCVLNFDDANGFLIGDLNKGMRAMFKMMNTERVAVGMQGLGISEAAYQAAVGYARERIQGRALSGARQPDMAADPLIVHPDVRRMLLTVRANSEGCRALAIWLGMQLDISAHEQDAEKRQEAEDLVALLTPVAKAYLTDVGFDSAVLGQQVFGGHGYIREHGMEQLVRDARIAQIYEGANGVQAMDLVGRKLAAEGGRYLERYFALIEAFISENQRDEALNEFVQPLVRAFGHLQEATGWLSRSAVENADEIGAAAYDYLRLTGQVTLALFWARMAKTALVKQAESDEAFYRTKLKTARFYMQRLLPQTQSLLASIRSGAASLMGFDEEEF